MQVCIFAELESAIQKVLNTCADDAMQQRNRRLSAACPFRTHVGILCLKLLVYLNACKVDSLCHIERALKIKKLILLKKIGRIKISENVRMWLSSWYRKKNTFLLM